MKGQLPVLNRSQQDGLDAAPAFVDTATQIFYLIGSAGTSKTILITCFIKMLDEQSRPVAILAQTDPTDHILRVMHGRTIPGSRLSQILICLKRTKL